MSKNMKKVIYILTLMALTVQSGVVLAVEKSLRNKSDLKKNVFDSGPSVLSIIPAQAEPGKVVTISGAGFGEKMFVYLGVTEIPAKLTNGRRLEFIVPSHMEPGIYVLNLKRGDGFGGRAYNFQILPLRPILTGLSTDSISSCAQGDEREVVANGQNFNEKSMLFFDGSVIRSRLISPESIAFTVPRVQGGLHQILVKNPPDISSVPYAISIDTKPEIEQISIGKENVSSYELIISGRNFMQNSIIYVDGVRIGGQNPDQREKLIYIDCNNLIYQRSPFSPVSKELRIQVMNQSGEGSQVVNVTAP